MPDFHERPFFIRVLVPTGDPDGLRILEKSNWPGVGVVFNRTNYKEVVNRVEFDKTEVGVIVDQGQYYAFAQDQVFTSPSTAAGVILGRTASPLKVVISSAGLLWSSTFLPWLASGQVISPSTHV